VKRWAGIDVGGSRKGFDLTVVDGGSVVDLRSRLRDPPAVLAALAPHEPVVVGVDSPASPAPPGARLREDERELARAVCGIRWTPEAATIASGSAYYEWARRGLELHRALRAELDCIVIEVFPTASWTRWFGPREGPRAAWTRAGLARLGLDGVPARTNQDVRDSIAAAVTAREHGLGRTEAFGEIVVPLAATTP
jgi:predicted nuclease with RNAse H fold